MTKFVFCDTETTGLNPDLHDVWEIAAVVREHGTDREYSWMVRPDLTHADPKALEIGGFYERFETPCDEVGTTMVTSHFDPEMVGETPPATYVAADLAEFLAGAIVVGSNPAFDQAFLSRWLRRHGQAWCAHYRTVDVVTLGAGRAMAHEGDYDPHAIEMPPSSRLVAERWGVDLRRYPTHTALGDARWVRDLYDAVTTGVYPSYPLVSGGDVEVPF
jgi:DNA polymerase III epsilon subunit-like protein